MSRATAKAAGRPSVVLLVMDTQGGLMAVRFPSGDAARDWEDENDLQAVGVARFVSSAEALKEAAS